MTTDERRKIEGKLETYRERLKEQRRNHSYIPDHLLHDYYKNVGRTEGNIGALEWVLRELTTDSTPDIF